VTTSADAANPAKTDLGRIDLAAKVAALIDAAAGDSDADYGGLGRFWRLSPAKLAKVQLMGMPLIAPVGTAKTCCGKGEGRGEASLLVRALRGLPPFDGGRFPRLPWGGTALADDDIAFIERWIDDGLPDGETTLGDSGAGSVEADPTAGFRVEGLSLNVGTGAVADYVPQGNEPKQRMNLDCLAPVQLEKLRYAFRELYNLNRWPQDARNYNNLALIHQNQCQHGWERFLPWHRVYLYEFEQALQDILPEVTMPYWDFTMARYVPAKPQDGEIIPRSLKAFLTADSLVFLADNGIPSECLATMVGRHFATLTSFFAQVSALMTQAGIDPAPYLSGQNRNRFIDALLATNPLWYPLRYPGQFFQKTKQGLEPSTINAQINYHYPTADDIAQIQSLRTFRDYGGGGLYNDSFGLIDQNPHNTMHIWTGGENPDWPGWGVPPPPQSSVPGAHDPSRGGAVKVAGRRFHRKDDLYQQPQFGDMFSNLTAAFDPVFWPVHSNFDRLWWEWQQAHPESNPADLDSVLTPWSYTIRDTLDMPRFGYEYVKSAKIVPVGMGTPVGRFAMPAIDVPEGFKDDARIEVRLHRVPQLTRSCFVRVFLNTPEAAAETPLSAPGYAGYLAIFGHGDCYGGPGHCDVPGPRNRRYDLRPPDHNTPRNHRVDVTRAAQRLIAAGAKSLTVNLVVIGVDYQEEPELLKLDGVSLSYFD
jgi:tyrosinase